jgi:leader peptidase (prepilin peptidase)/N-methyltransferase
VTDPLVVLFFVALGAFGLLFGSFGNVLIWRVPRGESIVSPGSHCPSCEHEIRWYDNIPVVSWLVLRGRCRDCGEPIAWRYPAVELASGLLWVIAGVRFGMTAATPLAIVFFYLLLILSVIDLDHRRLPTPIVATLAGLAAAAAVAAQVSGAPFAPLTPVASEGILASPVVASALGFVLGAGTAWAMAAAYGRLRGIDGMGFGDVRLLGAMGLVLGPFVLLAYGLANILGLVGSIPLLLRARRQNVSADAEGLATASSESGPEIETGSESKPQGRPEPLSVPFGPYLALGGFITSLWGPALWAAYLRILGA